MDASRKLARTYPQAVAGTTDSFKFDTTTGDFRLVFEANTAITAPTVIFAHELLNYPTGMTIDISPRGAAKAVKGAKNHIEIHLTETAKDGDKIIVQIKRK
jgi:endoglycosylceramidase